MILQDDMQTINILKPLSGAAMHDLGQIANRRFSQLQQLLTLQIALASLAGYGRHQSGAMLGQ